MIDPKELRIGNKVFLQNEVVTISELEKAGATFEENGFVAAYDYLTPIPLHPEWLEKFGFEEKPSYSSTDRHFSKEGFNGLADYGAQLIILQPNTSYLSCGYYENIIDCQYLHELQNLYFALTGEELMTKEKA